MRKHRILRRCLLTVAVAAIPGVSLCDSPLLAFEDRQNVPLARVTGSVPLKPVPVQAPRNRPVIYQAQYQAGSNEPASGQSTSVNQELSRLFQESGQQMPSMRPQDLPYANTPRTDLVRQKAAAPPAAPKQPGMLGRFFNRFRDKPQPEPNTSLQAGSPPPIRMEDGSILPTQRNVQGNQYRPVAPAANQYSGGQNHVPPQSPQGQVQQGQMGVSRVRSQQPTPMQNAAPANPEYQQPQPNTPVPAAQQQPRAAANPRPAAPAPLDDFENPFTDRGVPEEPDMLLDLDSLIDDVPHDVRPAPVEPVEQEPSLPAPAVDDDKAAPTADAAAAFDESPREDAVEPAVEGNPFTGVRLNVGTPPYGSDVEDDDAMEEDEFGADDPSDPAALDPQRANPDPADAPNPFMMPVSSEAALPAANAVDAVDAVDATDATDAVSTGNGRTSSTGDADQFRQPDRSSVLPPTAAEPLPIRSSPPPLNRAPLPPAVTDSSRDASQNASGRGPRQEISIRAAARPDVGSTNTRRLVTPGDSAAYTELLRQRQEQQRRDSLRERLVSRGHLTGFKGFCPVALRDQRELVEASESLTATFGLKTYYFSSEAAVARFQSDPARYAAAAGGSDVVLLINTGEETEGNLEYALWYRDRLYLFCSRETMKQFNDDPQKFANQY